MKAVVWHGVDDVRVERVPDPQLINPRDAIIRITTTAICGSDLHLLNGFIPTMKEGDVLGHEFMGEVVDVGRGNDKLKVGDRVVVPFTIACGMLTGGRGPDACIDAVGLEAHGTTLDAYYDKVKTSAMLGTDRPVALRQAIHACRKGGIVSIPGVYGGFLDKIPFGAAFQKGLTFKMGQTHVMKYMKPLLDRIERGDIDPSFVITHRLPLDDAPNAYKIFKEKRDHCIKVVLKPHTETVH